MKKTIQLLTIIIVIYFITAITLPKFMFAATLENHSEEMHETWEEFLESGVKIEYDETSSVTGYK